MITIRKADVHDATLIAELGKTTFIESHAHSAPTEDITAYVTEKYRPEALAAELLDPHNIFHLLYYNEQLAGYSKIIFNTSNPNVSPTNITKLERLYILKEYYDLKLGKALFDFNIQLARQAQQIGIWLFVWTGNHRAIRFYEKAGFVVVGNRPFKITERHYNPNYEMYWAFGS